MPTDPCPPHDGTPPDARGYYGARCGHDPCTCPLEERALRLEEECAGLRRELDVVAGERGAAREEGRRAGLEEAAATARRLVDEYLRKHGGGGYYSLALHDLVSAIESSGGAP